MNGIGNVFVVRGKNRPVVKINIVLDIRRGDSIGFVRVKIIEIILCLAL